VDTLHDGTARTPFQAFPGLPFDNPQRNRSEGQTLTDRVFETRQSLLFSAEAEDVLLPQVIELVGETQMVFGTDMPHGDRERFAGRELAKRKDISDSAKRAMLETNPLRLYGLR
jgi:predicted TIM-barrel fold metal-dependent hydrolase